MSKRYLLSPWCRYELEWFREQVHNRANDPGRVFVIHAQPTDETAWPDFLRYERANAKSNFTFFDRAKRPALRLARSERHQS